MTCQLQGDFTGSQCSCICLPLQTNRHVPGAPPRQEADKYTHSVVWKLYAAEMSTLLMVHSHFDPFKASAQPHLVRPGTLSTPTNELSPAGWQLYASDANSFCCCWSSCSSCGSLMSAITSYVSLLASSAWSSAVLISTGGGNCSVSCCCCCCWSKRSWQMLLVGPS